MGKGEKELTLGSLFDGSGGFPLAGKYSGIKPVWASEIEPYPIRVTTKRIPEMKHLGDVSKINGAEIEPVDIITFGSPCFPAGTLVLTDKGYIEIENIKVGMQVLTHEGRYRKVTAVGSKQGKTIILKGNHYGLECTANHPIYSSKVKYSYYNKNGKRNRIRELEETKAWIPAKDMLKEMWATPNYTETICIDKATQSTNRGNDLPKFNNDFFYFVGRWLGDGWVNNGQRSGRPDGQTFGKIIICGGEKKKASLQDILDKVIGNYTITEERTVTKFEFTNKNLCEWLIKNFGEYAYGKTLPSWAYSMPKEYRKALFNGIFDSDGYRKDETHLSLTTTSKKLAHSMRLLGETLGYLTSISFCDVPKTCKIEGRTVNQRPFYMVRFIKSTTKQPLKDNLHTWYKVRNIEETNEIKTVYNLTIEEDNSYIADGIVVHNCQDMSIAGKRQGLEGSRSNLFYEAIRIIKEMREATNGKQPRYAVWENVLGAFSSNMGADFRAVLEGFCSICGGGGVSIPQSAKWRDAGEILADGYSLAWRVLDAQFWGVPQRRKRIYLVADFGGQCAGKILFESEGMSGYSAEGFRAWKRTTEGIEESIGDTGTDGCTDEIGNSNQMVYSNHGQSTDYKECKNIAPTTSANYGEGGNNQPFVVNTDNVDNNAVVYENWRRDTRYNEIKDTAPTVGAHYGLGGNNQPLVVNQSSEQDTDEDEASSMVLNDQDGNRIDINHNISSTLRAKSNHPPCVINTNNNESIGDETENEGTTYAIQGKMIGRKEKNSPNGSGINEDVSFTLNTIDVHAVAYGIGRDAYNQGKNARYKPVITEEVQPTMTARGPGAVKEPVYSSGKGSFFTHTDTELADTLMATDYKDPQIVYRDDEKQEKPEKQKSNYTIRKLTPRECARLQGFPDNWCDNLGTDKPTEEEIEFWNRVFETYRETVTHSEKPKSVQQIKKWLRHPESDSAEYKMWGNGIALPCATFVLAGIAWNEEQEKE